MRKSALKLARENERLGGALEDTPTWLNEKNKSAAGHGIRVRITRLSAHILGLRFVRAMQRYGAARGALLAGGIAYSALFAIAGALAIGLTVFSLLLGSYPRLYQAVIESVNTAIPGILKASDSSEGLLDPQTLVLDNFFNPLTIMSALVLLWNALALMANLRVSIQSMFGIARLPRNFVVEKLLDLSAFSILGAGVMISTGVTAAAQLFAEPVFELLQFPDFLGIALMRSASIIVSFLVDMGVFIFLFRVMSGARALKWDLFAGASIGAAASAIVRFLGTAAVGSVAKNPLVASFAAIATLLLWVNLVARITLISAAFTANPPEQPSMAPEYFLHAKDTPNFVTKSVLETLVWDFDPVSGVTVTPALAAAPAVHIPRWRGLRAAWRRRKVDCARQKKLQAQAAYEIAQAHYDAGAIAAYRAKSRYSTHPDASKSMKFLPEVKN